MKLSKKIIIFILSKIILIIVYLYLWNIRIIGLIVILSMIELFYIYFEVKKSEGEFAEIIRIQKDVKEDYSAQMLDKQTKINTLQSQINPHFLYNTLECIRSEALEEGCNSIASMSKALAAFFRYSISRKENIVTILDEINNIRNYLLIQNYRFENKFAFILEIEDQEEEIYTYLIPKMTIQPIVENSIFHGLETKSGSSYVKLHIATSQNKVMLVISDNGIGMDKKTLEKLRLDREYDIGEREEKKDTQGNGIALNNVYQRLQLVFGDNCSMNIYSTQDVGTDVEIILPIVTEVNRLSE